MDGVQGIRRSWQRHRPGSGRHHRRGVRQDRQLAGRRGVDAADRPMLGKVDFSSLFYVLDHAKGVPASLAEAKAKGVPVIAYGAFINDVINFLIVAFVVFLLVKMVNRARGRPLLGPDDKGMSVLPVDDPDQGRSVRSCTIDLRRQRCPAPLARVERARRARSLSESRGDPRPAGAGPAARLAAGVLGRGGMRATPARGLPSGGALLRPLAGYCRSRCGSGRSSSPRWGRRSGA